jgi:hypothetical protein
MFYCTEIDVIECHNNTIGYQIYLIRANGTPKFIQGDIYASRAAAQNVAAKMLDAAAGLFEALDEQAA